MTEFIGPWQGGDEPLMSNVSPLPCLVIFILISSGSSTTPSESTMAWPSYVPSGIVAILARICWAARAQLGDGSIDVISAVTVEQSGQPLLAYSERRRLRF